MPATFGDLDFQIFRLTSFQYGIRVRMSVGNLVDQEKRDLIDAVCQMDQMIALGVLVTQTLIVIFVPSGL